MAAKAEIKGKVSIDGKGAQVGLERTRQSAEKFKNKMKQVGVAIAGAFAIGAIVNFAREVTELASLISDQALRAGLTTDTFQALAAAVRDAGGEEEMLVNVLAKVRQAQGRVIDGDEGMIKSLKSLGLEAEDFLKLDTPEALKAIADGLTKADNGAQQFNATAVILGEEAVKMIEVFNRLSVEGYGGLADAAFATGQVIDSETIQKLDEASDHLKQTERSMKVFFTRVISWLLDYIQKIAIVYGSLSTIGFKGTLEQIQAGTLFPNLKDELAKTQEQLDQAREQKDRERAARLEAYRARLEEARIKRAEELRKKLLASGAGGAGVDQLRAIGAGGRAAVDLGAREAARRDQERNKLLQQVTDNQKELIRAALLRAGFHLT